MILVRPSRKIKLSRGRPLSLLVVAQVSALRSVAWVVFADARPFRITRKPAARPKHLQIGCNLTLNGHGGRAQAGLHARAMLFSGRRHLMNISGLELAQWW
jgi:hypothetical protein